MAEKPYQQRETLMLLLVVKGMDHQEAADELGVGRTTISRWSRKLDIPKGVRDLITKEYFEYLFVEKNLTYQQMADKFDVSTQVIRSLAEEYDITPGRGKKKIYTDEELIEWLEVYILEFGVEPKCGDLRNWPGPKTGTYHYRFGSLDDALERVDLDSYD